MKTETRTAPVGTTCLTLAISLLWVAAGHLRAASPQTSPNAPCHRDSRMARSAVPEDIDAAQRFALKAAQGAAVRRVSRNESCRALFDALDLQGPEALTSGRYRPPRSEAERDHCRRGRLAFTRVDNSQIVLCERFHGLSRRSKMAILIHEALHTAGLGEAPSDPDGPTSTEITRVVRRACSL